MPIIPIRASCSLTFLGRAGLSVVRIVCRKLAIIGSLILCWSLHVAVEGSGEVEPRRLPPSGPLELVDHAAPVDGGVTISSPNTYWVPPFDEVLPVADSSAAAAADVAWRKGDYHIVPYGIGWLNVAFETSRTTTGAFALFAQSDDIQGEPSFIVNARATRLGFDVDGPIILGADTRGHIEFDFHGQAETENRSGVLLRHAYGEFKTESWRVVAGQTWDVISPLIPNTVNYGAGLASGNIGYRRAQVRGERYVRFGDNAKLTLQGSFDRSIVSDFAGAPNIQGEDAGWPTFMGRVAIGSASSANDGFFTEWGVSGHIGQEGVDFQTAPAQDDRRFRSWSLNADVRILTAKRYGFQGEFFVGEVLGTFLGGVNQGIDPVTRLGIHSIGGWGEAWYYVTPEVHTHLGFGIDDPRDSDLGFVPGGRRTRNQALFANVWLDITPMFTIGMELSWWKTGYVGLADGESYRGETVVKYAF